MFDEIINNPEKLITENYFDLQFSLEKKYGTKTLILMEIGSFYEVYQYENIGKAIEISKILNIALTKKNKSLNVTDKKNPLMCGIPSVSLEKHLEKLILENEWNIVLVCQEGIPPNIKRKIERIISPGTNTDFLNDEYNFIASVNIEKYKGLTYGGLSLIDVSIGKTLLFESTSLKDDPFQCVDDIKNILDKYRANEIIIHYDGFEEKEITDLFNYERTYFFKNNNKIDIDLQNQIFKKSFNIKSSLSPIEELNLELSPYLSYSLASLISFIIEHNISLSEGLSYPEIISNDKFLYLGNNPLEQLNIINTKNSIKKILNKGITSIGRRYIEEQLFNPIKDLSIIKTRQEKTKKISLEIAPELKNIYDIERIGKKIKIDKVLPFEIYQLYVSLLSTKRINEMIDPELKENLNINHIIKEIDKTFYIEKMMSLNLTNINSSFIKEGISKDLDLLNIELQEIKNKISKIIINVASFFGEEEKDDFSTYTSLSFSYTETEGHYIEMSKKRYLEVKEKISFKKKELKNSVKLFSEELTDLSKELSLIESKIISLNKKIFKEVISKLDIDLKEVISFICLIDFLLNNKRLLSLGYSFPIIEEKENSYISVKDLKHPLIHSNGYCIGNDLILGETNNENKEIPNGMNGLMLYGLNSSGKTTLSKALGILIIMGQAGFPVCASNASFSLFNNLFTRIKGEDDLERGLSTFAIEMIELKNILTRSDNKTLILGDEISHGTETTSGLSIVSSTVLELVDKNALFLFSTHLHQLREIEEFAECNKIADIHLCVEYDDIKDLLIYDRKIKAGSGSSLYGLEFAKYLKMPKSFLDRAYKIRGNIANDLSEKEILIKNKRSKYNNKFIVSSCCICGNKGTDVHHIKEQNSFSEEEIYLKNKLDNLVCLCDYHHKRVHQILKEYNGPTFEWKDTSNGKLLLINEEFKTLL